MASRAFCACARQLLARRKPHVGGVAADAGRGPFSGYALSVASRRVLLGCADLLFVRLRNGHHPSKLVLFVYYTLKSKPSQPPCYHSI